MKIRDYRDLIVWQRATELSTVCAEIVERLPRGARRGIAAQILDAADSVTANIAEGHSRATRRDYARFVGTARASVKEVENHLLTLERTHDLRGRRINLALSLCDECSRMLYVLRRRLNEL